MIEDNAHPSPLREENILNINNTRNKGKTRNRHDSKRKNKDRFSIFRRKRWLIFAFIISFNFSTSLDQAALSASTSELKEYFKITDVELGTLGSIVYIGISIGCVVTMLLINKFNRKNIIILANLITIFFQYIMTITRNFTVFMICRFTTGISDSFVTIYLPVWIDQFGIFSKRALMMSILHISSNFGYIFGYLISCRISWSQTLLLQNFLLAIHLIILYAFIDFMYFSFSIFPLKENFEKEFMFENNQNNLANNINNNMNEQDNNENDEDLRNVQGTHITKRRLSQVLININDRYKSIKREIDEESLFEESYDKIDSSFYSFLNETLICLKNFLFLATTLSITVVYFILAGIQFWINDYLETALNIPNKTTRIVIFSVIFSTSLFSGILGGGLVTTYFLGGYDTKYAIVLPFLSSLALLFLSNFVIGTSKIGIFCFFFWIYLFFLSILLPTLNGIILSSVEKKYAGTASALCTLIFNILGKFIGPAFYGVIKQKTKSYSLKIPMGLLLNSSLLLFIFVSIGCKLSFDRFKRNHVNENEIDLNNNKNQN